MKKKTLKKELRALRKRMDESYREIVKLIDYMTEQVIKPQSELIAHLTKELELSEAHKSQGISTETNVVSRALRSKRNTAVSEASSETTTTESKANDADRALTDEHQKAVISSEEKKRGLHNALNRLDWSKVDKEIEMINANNQYDAKTSDPNNEDVDKGNASSDKPSPIIEEIDGVIVCRGEVPDEVFEELCKNVTENDSVSDKENVSSDPLQAEELKVKELAETDKSVRINLRDRI